MILIVVNQILAIKAIGKYRILLTIELSFSSFVSLVVPKKKGIRRVTSRLKGGTADMRAP
jgi:hypothetical protein